MDVKPAIAWQPLTPRGVAAFARAPSRRLWLVQFCVALLVALSVAWFCYDGYFPVIGQAVAQLPAEGEMRSSRLDWRGDSPVFLAENHFLAISVDLEHTTKLRSVAHVQVEFSRTNFWVSSLFGYVDTAYPPGWVVVANRQEMQPLWGAWQPAILAGVIVFVIVSLFLSWLGLATLYAGPVWLLGFYLNRNLSLVGSWKLCGAALLPGALLMVLAISLYGLGVTDLVQMSFIYTAHLVLGWIYVFSGLFVVTSVGEAGNSRGNPFRSKPGR